MEGRRCHYDRMFKTFSAASIRSEDEAEDDGWGSDEDEAWTDSHLPGVFFDGYCGKLDPDDEQLEGCDDIHNHQRLMNRERLRYLEVFAELESDSEEFDEETGDKPCRLIPWDRVRAHDRDPDKRFYEEFRWSPAGCQL